MHVFFVTVADVADAYVICYSFSTWHRIFRCYFGCSNVKNGKIKTQNIGKHCVFYFYSQLCAYKEIFRPQYSQLMIQKCWPIHIRKCAHRKRERWRDSHLLIDDYKISLQI